MRTSDGTRRGTAHRRTGLERRSWRPSRRGGPSWSPPAPADAAVRVVPVATGLEPGRVHVHPERAHRLRRARHGRDPLPRPAHRRRSSCSSGSAGSTATVNAAPSAWPCTLAGRGSRSSTSTSRAARVRQPLRNQLVRLRSVRGHGTEHAGAAAVPDRLPRQPQRRAHRVRTRRQALRRDRRRRRGSLDRTGPHRRASRQDPAAQPQRIGAGVEPVPRQPRVVLRPPQLDRVRVRPADRQPVGNRERARVQRRDQPASRRAATSRGVPTQAVSRHEPGRPRPQLLPVWNFDETGRGHGRGLLRSVWTRRAPTTATCSSDVRTAPARTAVAPIAPRRPQPGAR